MYVIDCECELKIFFQLTNIIIYLTRRRVKSYIENMTKKASIVVRRGKGTSQACVHMPTDLHLALKMLALTEQCSLQDLIIEAAIALLESRGISYPEDPDKD